MSLNLDARQRAMLQEMGHPLWWPESAAPAAAPVAEVAHPPAAPAQVSEEKQPLAPNQRAPIAPESRADQPLAIPSGAEAPFPAPAEAAPAPRPARTAAASSVAPAAPIAPTAQAMPEDFPRVRFALRAPVLLDLREAKLQTEPAPASSQPAWLVVAELPEGTPPQGKAGQLVINMLRAMRLTDAPVYWVPLARLAPGQDASQGDEGQEPPSHSIDALVQDTGAAMALVLGLPAARHLLGGEQPFSRLRQQVHQVGAGRLPAVVTYDPSHLLRVPKAKGETWADLCLALAHAGR
ncbi:uracil-DNA glycosylase family protein [Comamonas testosteroni]